MDVTTEARQSAAVMANAFILDEVVGVGELRMILENRCV
jgi:hypothetical protein